MDTDALSREVSAALDRASATRKLGQDGLADRYEHIALAHLDRLIRTTRQEDQS